MTKKRKCCDVCYPRKDNKPPLSACAKAIERWVREATESARNARNAGKIPKNDLPPGMDPDDRHKYKIRLP